MPTGPAHVRVKRIEELIYEPLSDCEACRCMIGKDHDENGMTVSDYWYEQDEDGSGGALSEYEAADIWASSGGDEDYSFGYSNEELEDAANEGDSSTVENSSGKRRFSFRGLFGR